MNFTYKHPRPVLSVDIVIIKAGKKSPEVLLIRRAQPPFEDHWALPGGFVDIDEDLEAAARRELAEETGLVNLPLRQLHTYGHPGRDPRGRVVTVVYYAQIPTDFKSQLKAGSDASQVNWFPLEKMPPLAFDHGQIIADALSRLV